MCGIAGFISEGSSDFHAALLGQMCDRIAHRGPDAFGYYRQGSVALGHRRLSIIDVGGGKQPLGNEDGSVQIVFNGEIYNYLELRADLVRKGHRFATDSDTEVLVHLYEEVGESLPEHLNGMFAFAIWDARKQELFLARDRFGKKPLYYSTAVPGFRFCFASELKALTVLPGFDSSISAESLADFLTFGYVPDPQTIYRNVWKLQPGRSLLVTSAGNRERRYWAPPFGSDEGADFERAVAEVEELAGDSVERRMMADVPLGGFLSGGVDSSAVVAYMAKRAGHRVKTFSIGFTDEAFSEVRYARMVAQRYGTEHHEEIVTPSVHETLRTLVEHYDEPFADASAIPTLYLARMTRQHVTVALSGDGADELFGGYQRYRIAVAQQQVRQRIPEWIRRSVIGPAAKYYPKLYSLPRIFRAKSSLTELAHSFGQAYADSMSSFRFGLLQNVLAPELRRELKGYSPYEKFTDRFTRYRDLSPLKQIQAVDVETYLPGDILVKVDRATMAYSLEARCPWLDYRMGELACRLPESFHLHGGVAKRLFKAAARPHIPPEIIDRKKMGFGSPVAAWFRSSLKSTFESLVLRPEMGRYIDLDVTRRMWQRHQSGSLNYGPDLWALLMVACWEDRHVGSCKGEILATAV
jgi:asparagine synthase (glutamine-hydrolysing)